MQHKYSIQIFAHPSTRRNISHISNVYAKAIRANFVIKVTKNRHFTIFYLRGMLEIKSTHKNDFRLLERTSYTLQAVPNDLHLKFEEAKIEETITTITHES